MKGKPVISPIYHTSTYEFETSEDLIDVVQNHEGYLYSRWDNPSVVAVEQALAQMEGTDKALGFGSGMAAITTGLLAFAQSGTHIVATRQLYGGTFEFLNDILPRLNIHTTFVNCWEQDAILAEIEKGLDILYLESPTNPLLRVVDIQPLSQAAHQKNAIVMLDSTFASPVNQRPIDLDVDIILHSATKYLGGHHDLTAGILCCSQAHYDQIWSTRKILGGLMDPNSAFLTLRGLKTLELRIHQHNHNAQLIAEFLQSHPKIKAVHFPGLPDHPDHQIARRQMSGFGGMLSFDLKADFDQTKGFMDNLQFIKLATSLGGVTSLATQPITNTHFGLSPENRVKAGVGESLVRLSVGIENPQALIEDLKQALDLT
jgi:cystathionine beta-lyase/cystathionine gamma-synthase